MKSTLLITLILLSFKLSAQFNLAELKEIRKAQIKAIYCDSLLLNRQQRITLQDKQIRSLNQSIVVYQEKEVINQEKEIYYRELIRSRDTEINKLHKRNKVYKIGCISLGVSTLVFGSILYLNK